MNQLAPEISIGDAIRAWRILSPANAEELRDLCSMLGLIEEPVQFQGKKDGVIEEVIKTDEVDLPEKGQFEQTSLDTAITKPKQDKDLVERGHATHSLSGKLVPFELSPLPPIIEESGSVSIVGSPSDLLEPVPDEPLPLVSLFNPDLQRALVSSAVSVQVPEGPIDISHLIQMLVSGKLVATIPRQSIQTVRRGLQLLLDLGESMLPFLRDVVTIEQALRHLVGQDAIQVLRFAECPIRGAGPRARSSWKEYQPPPPGRPVLVLTNFGLANPLHHSRASLEEWLNFADRVREAGCPLIAFVPLPRSRWPHPLSQKMIMVPWDRPTTLGDILRAREATLK